MYNVIKNNNKEYKSEISNFDTDFFYKSVANHYEVLEENFEIKVINTKQYDTPVNFKQAKTIARHKWYTYKEGFSPLFVKSFIERFSTENPPVVFDPFGGIGTTVLESAILGLNSFSNDVNPMSNFISKVKSFEYSTSDKEKIESYLHTLKTEELVQKSNEPDNKTVLKYFSQGALDAILKIKKWIEKLPEDHIRNFFNLGLLTILETISTHKKDGNGVKKKSKYPEYNSLALIRQLFIEKIFSFLEDMSKTSLKVLPVINHQSSFNSYKLSQKADLVITSPPYANCFDYSKVYLIELWFGEFFKSVNDQKEFRESSIISHVHYSWKRENLNKGSALINEEVFYYLSKQKLWNKKIPIMLKGYFSDMENVLKQLIPNLNNGATVGIVVGNSVYAGLPIATDLLLSEIALRLGFEVVSIEIYRNLSPSSQQSKIIAESSKKYLRESLIILKWK